jgi:integrase
MYPKYLTKDKTNTIYHFVSYIPKDLLHLFDGRKRFRISLGCGNKVLAKKISLYLNQHTKYLYNNIRMGKNLTIVEIKEILKVEVRKQFAHAKHYYLGTNEFDKEHTRKSLENISTRQAKMKEDLSGKNIKEYEKEIDKKLNGILTSLDIEIEPNSINYKEIRRRFIQLYVMRLDWCKTLIEKKGNFSEDDFRRQADETLGLSLYPSVLNPIIENYEIPEPREPYLVETKSVEVKYNKVGKGKKISDVVEEFLILRKGTLGQKLLDEYKSICGDFVEIVGDLPIGSLSKEDIRGYITTQIQLPPQRKKNPIYRDLSVSKILKMKDVKPQSRQNVNKYLTRLSTMMNFGLGQGYFSSNFILGMKIPVSKTEEKKREPFTDEDLIKVLSPKRYFDWTIDYKKISSNQHTTFRTDRKGKIGNPLYWIFLVGIFSGMRTNEILQMKIADVVKQDNIWMIIIDESGGKRVKTSSGIRNVPVHPKLLHLGFIEYVEIIKSKGFDRVFPELIKDKEGYTSKVSEHYNNKFLPVIGVHKPRIRVLYSTRHTFVNRCYKKGVDRDIIKQIVGHSKDFTFQIYGGNPYSPKQLYNGISKVSYANIRWDRLLVDWKGRML